LAKLSGKTKNLARCLSPFLRCAKSYDDVR
jgi:hypothetical protein